MKIKLNRPLAGSTAVDEQDVLGLKNGLNRLGFYKPYEKVGVTAVPDAGLFDALKSFQNTWKLPATGEIRPDDDTMQSLNSALSKKAKGQYFWRSAPGDQACCDHKSHIGSRRSWSNGPHPTDHDCNCWAEQVSDSRVEKEVLKNPERRIPDTNIPDRGIPDSGHPQSRLNYNSQEWRMKMDPYIADLPAAMMARPQVNMDSRMEISDTTDREQFFERLKKIKIRN